MVYNPNENKLLTKKELYSMAWRSLFLQASFNYERMQAGGWVYSLLPALKKIYKDKKDELIKAMKEHLEFFNTHPFLVTPILGIIAAMEEKGADREAIRGVKVALMGPLGGIGDALLWLTALPIMAGLGASLAMQGNPLGPILFLVLFNILHFGLVFWGINYGYNTGLNALSGLRTGAKIISALASIVGLTVVGALIASYINMKTPLVIHAGQATVKVQKVLDEILPNMLPLIFTLFIYWLLKKGLSPSKIIGIVVLFGIVSKYFGIF
ncbi:PTS system mannose/fructose/sorbose family transporter subunit IID [Thermoanaerobacter sp. CM-CNRG TB177]|jgi:PTS system N-acetylgalactosamine-specific IID component|uniref:PTS system mannose/fructose/sorbose family transporter subunit IID n=1 Tax=Thermoanaerobacter sp. CM-CNRG TB177 TaxID=2800659 RepID=UPI001BDDCDAA|nr:PTS system mannose/fructose/sorbose family transporter subunit IID [Thermoanaerobacter sp. CM-CNRG TB177]MBT1279143.1 PTS system mannose/fructose/sorbose family transporter subunit IID [Thermoanaerobacter sp. CM-CNRG TB177]